MMQVDLHGGFGEKGRTSVAIRSAASHILLDVGIKVCDAPGAFAVACP
jgi:predicted metal-dependent RNase